MTNMFGSTGGDFDFGPGALADMELWFDPSAVHDGSASARLSMPAPAPPASGPGSMRDLSFDMTDIFGSTGGDFDFNSDMELWFDPSAINEGHIDL
jgi:hypothetical protein